MVETGRRVGLAVTAALWLAPSPALAAPIEFVEAREQYWIFEDVGGTLEQANWFSRDPFLESYADVESGFLAAHPDDSQFLILYTTWTLPPPVGALYQAVANDVHGIGFEHIAPLDTVIPTPYFDDTPNSMVSGFMHMNDWTQYLGDDPGGVDDRTISLIFGQELGHAWLSFVHWRDGRSETIRDDMLGRSDAHWSFYMHSGGSPVEGHDWVDNGDGTFTAIKHDLFRFSDLDLYLMGLLPAAEVEPWFILEDPTHCVDSSLEDGSCAPPEGHGFAADSYTVTATRRDITIDDVIASEGARMPAFPDAPNEFDASFVLLTRPGEELSEAEKLQFDIIVARSIEIFNEQTDGAGSVVNRTAQAGGADDGPGDGADDGSGSTGASTGSGATADAGNDSAEGNQDDGTGGAQSGGGGARPRDEEGCGCRTNGRGDPERQGPVALLLGMLVYCAGRRRATRPA